MQWFKCSEQMPGSGMRVLACHIDNMVPRVDWVDDFGNWASFPWPNAAGFTHWMPLPPPPTE